ncbi:MAG TPA: FAD-dependent oxidoreductase, partial [Casimicrobiaceae bacterium]
MRPRDLTRLESTAYDLLVVGGGIQGLTIAYEAASRGLSVALVESGDFGGGTSFNHQKTAHGGLRALSTGQIGRARESIRERRALARIAPWLLRPLPFIIGTYRSVVKNR